MRPEPAASLYSEQERLRQASQCYVSNESWGAGAVPPTHHWPQRPGTTLEQALQPSGLPDHPLGCTLLQGSCLRNTDMQPPVCVPAALLTHSRQARLPRLSARAPQHRANREPAIFLPEAQVPSPRSTVWMPCSLLVLVCSHHHRGEALKAGKPHCPGRLGPSQFPSSLTPDSGRRPPGTWGFFRMWTPRWPSPGPWLPQHL